MPLIQPSVLIVGLAFTTLRFSGIEQAAGSTWPISHDCTRVEFTRHFGRMSGIESLGFSCLMGGFAKKDDV